MISGIKKDACCGCSACVSICPQKCISMVEDKEGFLYPQIGTTLCVGCSLCRKVCPNLMEPTEPDCLPIGYGAYAKETKIHAECSSGGVSYLLAEQIVSRGGIVYGCAMDFSCQTAMHIRADSIEALQQFKGSKYIQSDLNDTFKLIENDLNNNKLVLFFGVPCQINGLRSFLCKDFKNLLCCEVICHGVSSPLVWKAYMQYLEKKYHSSITAVSFRSKGKNQRVTVKIINDNKQTIFIPKQKNLFMKLYLQNYSVRPSCYNCDAKKTKSLADITLGDLWGVEFIKPELNNKLGTSCVFINTDKGKQLFTSVCNKLFVKEISSQKAIKANPSYYESVKMPEDRADFFRDIKVMSFPELTKHYYKAPPLKLKQWVLSELYSLYNLFSKKRKTTLKYGMLVEMSHKRKQ